MPRPSLVDVLLVHLGDPTGSSRALRQIRRLVAGGRTVGVLGMGAARAPEALPPQVGLAMLPRPGGQGPRLFWRAHRALRSAALARPARLVLASDLHALPAAHAAAQAHGARLVYDAREWYAGLDAAAGRPLVGRVWAAVEAHYAPRADAVLTVNDAIADRLARERGVARPVVVRNIALPRGGIGVLARTGALRARLGLDDRAPLVLYQGLFRAGRGLEALVGAVALVPDVRLVLVGEGDRRASLERLAAELAPGRVSVLPFEPPDALAMLTPDADVGAVPIEPLTESLRLALPNKLFEYAAAGVPVLAGAGVEPMRALVERFGAGIAVDVSPAALADGLRRMLEAGAAARFREGIARLRAAFPPEAEMDRFEAVVERLLSRG